MTKWVLAGLLGVAWIGGAAAVLAADGLGLQPLSCSLDGPQPQGQFACQIRGMGTQYREKDARIDKLKRLGYALAFPAIHARDATPQTLSSVVAALQPGDHLVLADGDWSNIAATIDASGTFDAPIIVRPKTLHGVTFKGRTALSVIGQHVILLDLKISDGATSYPLNTQELLAEQYPADPAFPNGPKIYSKAVLNLGHSGKACNYCAMIDVEISGLGLAGFVPAHSSLLYLQMRGLDSTVAYSSFKGLSSLGHYIAASYPSETLSANEGPSPARLHLYRNYFGDRGFNTDENGYELLQMGWSGVRTQSMFGRIEENLFENSAVPHGDTELVTMKCNDWIIRNNTFRNTTGGVTLRSANRILVEGNYFLAGDPQHPSASGIRVLGEGHWIVGNYFYQNARYEPTLVPYYTYDASHPAEFSQEGGGYYYSVVVSSGDVESTSDPNADGEPRAKNVVIANNTFAYGVRNMLLGAWHGAYPRYPLLPDSVVVKNNVFRSDRTVPWRSDRVVPSDHALPLIVLPAGADGTAYLQSNRIEGNMLSPNPDATPVASVTGLDSFGGGYANLLYGLDWAYDNYVYWTNPASTTINAAAALWSFPVVASGTAFDMGAFQTRAPVRRPLYASQVGSRGPVIRSNWLADTEALETTRWYRNRLRAFDTSGSASNSTGSLSPDGWHNAEFLREDATFGTHSFEQIVSANPAQTYTFSIYLKAGGPGNTQAAMLYIASPQDTNSGVALRVDLATGAVHSAYKNGTATYVTRLVQPVGNGWYRLSVTGRPTASAGTQVRAVVYLLQTPDGNGYQGNASSGLFAWGAQLEADVIATALESN